MISLIKGLVGLIALSVIARVVNSYSAVHSTDRLARLVHLPRLRGESLAAWDARIEAAFQDLKATVASVRDAVYQGHGRIIAMVGTPTRHTHVFSKQPAGKHYGPN
jgi:hypothetical protein